MRIFKTLATAADEIQRDIYKAGKMNVSRVQQWDDLELIAREAFGYSYTILPGGIPKKVQEVVDIGVQMDFPLFEKTTPAEYMNWLLAERELRASPLAVDDYMGPTEALHPNLKKTFEGSHPSYTYRERLIGLIPTVVQTLRTNKDSRRAYWPVFRLTDAYRSAEPTRIPCTLGYHFAIRTLGDGAESLMMIYSQRSADFDNFWLSDVWLANQLQNLIAKYLEVEEGPFIHMIHSFHSFEVGGQEIY